MPTRKNLKDFNEMGEIKLDTDNEGSKFKILFVDDIAATRKIFSRTFADRYIVLVAGSKREAEKILERDNDIAILISDQRMPGESGIELLELARWRYPKMVRIISTAFSDYNVIVEAINRAKVFTYIDKPWNMELLIAYLASGIEYYKAGNRDGGLIYVDTPENSVSSNEIEFDKSGLGAIEAILKIMESVRLYEKQRTGTEGKFSIAQVSGEIVVSYNNPETDCQRSVSVAKYQEKAKELSVNGDEDQLIDAIFGRSAVIEADEIPSETAVSTASKDALAKAKGVNSSLVVTDPERISRVIQVRTLAETVSVRLLEILSAVRQLDGKGSSAELVDYVAKSRQVIDSFKKISILETLDNQLVIKSLSKLRASLTPFEQGREPFRSLVVERIVDQSTIAGIFIAHNALATLYNTHSIHASSSMVVMASISEEENGGRSTALFAGVILVSPLLIYCYMILIGVATVSDSLHKLVAFVALLGACIVCSVACHKGMGMMKLDQKLRLGEDITISLAATGAIAIFVFTLTFGGYIVFF